MHHRTQLARGVLTALLALSVLAGTAGVAHAISTPDTSADDPDMTTTVAEPSTDPSPPPSTTSGGVDTGADPVPADDSVVWFTVTGQEISASGTSTTLDPRVSATGTGGTSSEGGCKTIRITNVGHTVLHLVAYKFWTQVHWCWDRSRKQISQVSRAWDFCCVAGTFRFDGIVPDSTHSGFYGWLGALYPHSGYYYNKTASFTNVCHLPACFKPTYPKNKIHVHSNGTWWFSKTGAG